MNDLSLYKLSGYVLYESDSQIGAALQLFFYSVQNCRDFQELPLITPAKLSGRFLSEIYEKFKIFFIFSLIFFGLCVNLQLTFTSTNLLCTT